MPLPAELEALLGFIPEGEREAKRKHLEELHAGNLRQQDFSRKMNELGEREKKLDAGYKEGTDWVEKHKGLYSEAVKQVNAFQARNKELEEKIKLLEDKPFSDLNLNDEAAVGGLLKELRDQNTRNQEQIDRLTGTITDIESKFKSGEFVTKEVGEQQLQAMGTAVLNVGATQSKAKKEYGLDIEMETILEKSKEFGGDMNRTYDALTADARTKKMKDEIRADLEKEYQDKLRDHHSPIATGDTPLGPLQQRIAQLGGAKDGESTIPDNVDIKNPGLGRMVAQELRNEGKF